MILIVGCGFLGSYLAKYALTQTDEPVLGTVRNLKNAAPLDGVEYIQCDVLNEHDLTALKNRCCSEPLTVFYFAACHNIDFIFENPSEAYRINIDALEKFISYFPNIEKLFFASTDCVYGEGDFRFGEDSFLNPVNEYGRQKIAAENIVRSKGFNVLRFPFMLGKSLASKPHFYDDISVKLSNGTSVEMIDGMYRSVLSYEQAAKFTFELSLLPCVPQTVNVCSDSVLSKYDMGLILAKKLGVPASLIKKISEEEGRKFFKAKRASCTAMDNSLLKSLLGLEKIQWEEEEKC